MDGLRSSRYAFVLQADASGAEPSAAWRLCGEGSLRPPPRSSAAVTHCGPVVASARSRPGDQPRGSRAARPALLAAASAASFAWTLNGLSAHAERLYPPLDAGRGGGGGGGGGGGKAAQPVADRKPGGRKRIMILMSDTGGGHRASAEALKAAFEIKFGNQFQVHIVDLWSNHSPYPANNIPKSYNFLVRHGWLWRLNFETTSHKVVHESIFGAFGAVAGRTFAAAFDSICPDLVVSVHPLMQHVPLRVLARRAKGMGAPPPPFATVVTDLTSCHPTWFHPAVDACFVPTQQVATQAFAQGLRPSQVVMHGLPIRPSFAQPLPARRTLRRRLGLEPDGPAVLLMGGGEGMGSLEATAEALAAQLQPGAQVVVVCGRNAALAARLSAKAERWAVRVHVKGFLSNINEWMGACDLVITKAGPGTIAEALILGVPLLLNGAIPCQEEGNVPYVVQNKVGLFLTDPKAIAAQVAAWFGPARAELAEMAKRAKALGRPHATYDIVEDLKALCERRPVRAMA